MFSRFVFSLQINSLVNEDPNQRAYQDSNDQPNSINHDSAEGEIDFDTNLFGKSNQVESDDFYGRTREIIIFAKKGKKYNIFWSLAKFTIRFLWVKISERYRFDTKKIKTIMLPNTKMNIVSNNNNKTLIAWIFLISFFALINTRALSSLFFILIIMYIWWI